MIFCKAKAALVSLVKNCLDQFRVASVLCPNLDKSWYVLDHYGVIYEEVIGKTLITYYLNAHSPITFGMIYTLDGITPSIGSLILV